MVKELLFRAVFEHKKDLAVLLTANGLTWWSMYYVPVMGVIASTVTVITGVVILKREYMELKTRKKQYEERNYGGPYADEPEDTTGPIDQV